MTEAATELSPFVLQEENVAPTPSVLLKVVMDGDSRVGKTNIFNMYLRRQMFKSIYKASIGIDFGLKEISFQGENYKLQLWDTAGDRRYRQVARTAARGAEGIVAVYDITYQESLDTAVQRIQETMDVIGKQESSKCAIVIVGNKLDQEHKREVATDEGRGMADRFDAGFIECSAANNMNVDDIFQLLLKERFKKLGKKMTWWKK